MKPPFGSELSTLSLCSLVLLLSPGDVKSGPLNIDGPSREVANNSLVDFDSVVMSRGCRYKTQFYHNGEEVSTSEPCLACQCKGTVVVCKLRICPEIPVPPPPGCIVVQRAKSCCAQLICHGDEPNKKISREQRFPANMTIDASSNETKDAGYCVLDGTVYAEGSAMRSSTLCQYCFCIRGEMKCSSPQCVIPLNGCKPRFRSYACCPTNYDCGQSNETAILKTMPSSTQVPQFLKGCLVNGQFVPEGEPVLPVQLAGYGNATSSSANLCQTCFCMGGMVHCRPLQCDQPIDGCVPIKEDGHCCPDRYDCSKPQQQSLTITSTETTQPSSFSTLLPSSTMQYIINTTTRASTSTESPEDEIIHGTMEELGSGATTIASYQDSDSTTSANDDSFERIASMMTSSSEEKSSTLPSLPQARVSATTLGGFKNRSDLGSREERRSKDGDEFARKHSMEDDERDEFAFHTFDSTISNAIEELAATTLFEDPIQDSTNDPDINTDLSFEMDTTEVNRMGFAQTATSNNEISESDQVETTLPYQGEIVDDEAEISNVPTPSAESFIEISSSSISPSSDIPSSSSESTSSEMPSTSTTLASSTTSTSSTTTDLPVNPQSSSTEASLEFIPFVEDDVLQPAVNQSLEKNKTTDQEPLPHLPEIIFDDSSEDVSLPQDGNLSLLKPLHLKFINGTEESYLEHGSTDANGNLDVPLPILVEDDFLEVPEPPRYNDSEFAVSSSLYNNGYYPNGDIIIDVGPAEDLIVSEGELNNPNKLENKDNVAVDDEFEELYNVDLKPVEIKDASAATPSTTESTPVAQSTVLTTTTRRSEQPLKAISSNDKFIPSFSPATVPTTSDSTSFVSPSRTYTKFSIQDVPHYRHDQNTPSYQVSGLPYVVKTSPPGVYHHRYYNEPEEIPPSRVQTPYNYYSTSGSNNNKQVLNTKQRGQGGSSVRPLYKNNQFFYEDSSAALDSYEDYESYLQTTSNGISTPSSAPVKKTTPRGGPSTRSPIQFLGERLKLPSYNQQRAPTTPKYKYAHFNNKATNTQRSSTERTTTSSDFKTFPFSLPRSQDNLYNLGIKLSGCNVVGKMYSVGEVIEELSSNCLRCMCSDIGVHCAELKC